MKFPNIKNDSRLARYTFVLVVILITFGLKLFFIDLLGRQAPFLIAVLAVAIGSLYGGLGPGIIATFITAFLSNYFFIEPYNAIALSFNAVVDTIIYIVQGLIIVWLIDRQKKVQKEKDKILKEVNNIKYALDQSSIVAVTDTKGVIQYVNDKFVEISGYGKDELIGNTHHIINSGYHSRKFFKKLWDTILAGKVWHGEVKNRKKNGTFYWAYATITPVFDEKGKLSQFIAIRNDITERKKMEDTILKNEKQLRESRDQLNIIFQNIAEGIIVQESKKIIYINKTAAEFFGNRSIETYLQKSPRSILSVFDIVEEKGQPFVEDEFPSTQALRGKSNPEKRYGMRDKKSGEVKWVTVKARPIFDEKKKVLFVVVLFHDVTEQIELEQRKNEFISMASHELKTPITSMKLFLDILDKEIGGDASSKAHIYVKRLHDQANKLRELVGDLLDVSRIETGKLRFYKEKFRLDELIEETVISLRPMSNKHELVFKNKDAVEINADKFRLYQVITNLITNAIKYSPNSNKVIITVHKNTSKALVKVKDFGIGLEKKQHEKIFDKLYQVPDSHERTFPGLGMGLYISREIIKRHGGDIWVESKKGKGSTFYFSLPINK